MNNEFRIKVHVSGLFHGPSQETLPMNVIMLVVTDYLESAQSTIYYFYESKSNSAPRLTCCFECSLPTLDES